MCGRCAMCIRCARGVCWKRSRRRCNCTAHRMLNAFAGVAVSSSPMYKYAYIIYILYARLVHVLVHVSHHNDTSAAMCDVHERNRCDCMVCHSLLWSNIQNDFYCFHSWALATHFYVCLLASASCARWQSAILDGHIWIVLLYFIRPNFHFFFHV